MCELLSYFVISSLLGPVVIWIKILLSWEPMLFFAVEAQSLFTESLSIRFLRKFASINELVQMLADNFTVCGPMPPQFFGICMLSVFLCCVSNFSWYGNWEAVVSPFEEKSYFLNGVSAKAELVLGQRATPAALGHSSISFPAKMAHGFPFESFHIWWDMCLGDKDWGRKQTYMHLFYLDTCKS